MPGSIASPPHSGPCYIGYADLRLPQTRSARRSTSRSFAGPTLNIPVSTSRFDLTRLLILRPSRQAKENMVLWTILTSPPIILVGKYADFLLYPLSRCSDLVSMSPILPMIHAFTRHLLLHARLPAAALCAE